MLSSLYVKIIGVVIVVSAILGGILYVKNLQSKLEEKTKEVAVLNAKIIDQNAAVQAFKEESEARLAAAQKELEEAKLAASKGKARARIIYKASPSTPGNDCKSALDLLNTEDATIPKALETMNGSKK